MARITVEDCLEVVDNRFQLVMMAAKRARQLSKGVASAIDGDPDDKPTVTALREIAARRIDLRTIDEIEQAERERAEREALAGALSQWDAIRSRALAEDPAAIAGRQLASRGATPKAAKIIERIAPMLGLSKLGCTLHEVPPGWAVVGGVLGWAVETRASRFYEVD